MGSLQNPQKSSETINFKHLTRDCKATLKQGQQIKTFLLLFPFLSSHALIPKGSESLGSKLGKRSREQRNFTFSQAWTLRDWKTFTELRLGLQIKVTLEVAFFP